MRPLRFAHGRQDRPAYPTRVGEQLGPGGLLHQVMQVGRKRVLTSLLAASSE